LIQSDVSLPYTRQIKLYIRTSPATYNKRPMRNLLAGSHFPGSVTLMGNNEVHNSVKTLGHVNDVAWINLRIEACIAPCLLVVKEELRTIASDAYFALFRKIGQTSSL